MSIKNNTTSLQEVLEILSTKAAGGEQATPEITVSSNGLITATAGTKTSTHQLAFQSAKTITPSTTSQIAVSSGYYTGGNITVASVPTQTKNVTPTSTTQNITPDSGKFLSKVTVTGDNNLVASNIKNGVSIFGVNGTLEESSGSGEAAEWSENEDAIINRTITSYTNNRVKLIGYCAFYDCSRLTTVSFPMCSYISTSAFAYCGSLTTASFPACTGIGYYAFASCSSLTTVSFPICVRISYSAFYNCKSLTTVSFPACTKIENYAFYNCISLTTVFFPACINIETNAFISCSSLTTISFPACTSIRSGVFTKCYCLSNILLGASSVCKLSNSNAFSSTPFAGYSSYFSGTPYIYVPASLVDAYKSATNWTYFSSYFSSIESLEGDNNSGSNEGSGSGESNLITFTIGGTEYQAEKGMTWGEWVESEYNIGNYFIPGLVVKNDIGVSVQYNGIDCQRDDVIISSAIYTCDIESGELPPEAI